MELTREDIENVQRQIDELKAKLEKDKFKDLKKAYSEGAIIECNLEGKNGWLTKIPEWSNNYEYRIKDNISMSSWQAHKDIIKQWWHGDEIEFYNVDEWNRADRPSWSMEFEYRIKPATWELPEYEYGSELTQKKLRDLVHYDSDTGIFTRLKNTKIAGSDNGRGTNMSKSTAEKICNALNNKNISL